jgi:D-alanyl-D-alanine carboxypeptidase
MKKILAYILTFVVILLIPTKSFADTKPFINAQTGVLIDLNTGQVLYDKGMHEKLAPASTTKIITALLTLEKCKLDDIVTVGSKPPYEDGSKLYLIEGEEISVKDLLYGMMLESANDAALALAEHISGSGPAFADLMNKKAKELGCTDTNFVNPNGLYDDNHFTSAYDLALIAKAAMENPTFREIVSTKFYEIHPTNKQTETRYIYNINRLVRGTQYNYEGADGVKTGYTTKSKNTIVASATRGDRRLLAVELKSTKDVYEDAIKLLDFGFNEYTSEKIIDSSKPITNIQIKGVKAPIPVYPKKDFNSSALKGTTPEFTQNIVLNESFRKINKGDEIGYVEVTLDNNMKYKIPLIAGDNYKSTFFTLKSKESGVYKRSLKNQVKFLFLSIIPILYIRNRIVRIRRKRKQKMLFSKNINNRNILK